MKAYLAIIILLFSFFSCAKDNEKPSDLKTSNNKIKSSKKDPDNSRDSNNYEDDEKNNDKNSSKDDDNGSSKDDDKDSKKDDDNGSSKDDDKDSSKDDTSKNATDNPLEGLKYYVDPYSQSLESLKDLTKGSDDYKASEFIGSQTAGKWIGSWTDPKNPKKQVADIVDTAVKQGEVPIFIMYNIPDLDCGQYSANSEVLSPKEYSTWTKGFAEGTQGKKVVVVVEPDGLGLINECTAKKDDFNSKDQVANVKTAITNLASNKNAILYLDMGYWMKASLVAEYLPLVDPDKKLRGIALNTSNYQTSKAMTSKCKEVIAAVKGRKITCIIDTSRNGNGPIAKADLKEGEEDWCNPPDRAIGSLSTTKTTDPAVDAYLWLKLPGESDGDCKRKEPSAGMFWQERATELFKNSDHS